MKIARLNRTGVFVTVNAGRLDIICEIDYPIVLILDGNSEIGAHVRSNLRYSICFKHFIESWSISNLILFSVKTYFPSYVRNLL